MCDSTHSLSNILIKHLLKSYSFTTVIQASNHLFQMLFSISFKFVSKFSGQSPQSSSVLDVLPSFRCQPRQVVFRVESTQDPVHRCLWCSTRKTRCRESGRSVARSVCWIALSQVWSNWKIVAALSVERYHEKIIMIQYLVIKYFSNSCIYITTSQL